MPVSQPGPLKAAIWARVSTDHQSEQNQVPDLERFCDHRGYAIAKRYLLSDVSAFNGAHKETLHAMLDDAWRGEFSVLVVWALDRICREGVEELLKLVRQLSERNVVLMSVKESWVNGSDERTTELLLSIAGWMAQQESARRSERIKAALARRKAEGKPVGRQAGARDRRKRRTHGYAGNRNAARTDDSAAS